MLDALKPVLYVQVSPQRLTVRDPKTGASISEPPEVAVAREPKPRVLGLGAEARNHQRSPAVELVNPFAHPRSLISDFTLGEQLVKAFVQRLRGRSLLAIAPKVVLHLQADPTGGFTQVEIRAFSEMALGAGASQVTVWQGRDLTDHELLSGQFPSEGRVLGRL